MPVRSTAYLPSLSIRLTVLLNIFGLDILGLDILGLDIFR